jgi:hypothetical protein
MEKATHVQGQATSLAVIQLGELRPRLAHFASELWSVHLATFA